MARDDWRLRIELKEAGSNGLLERLGLVNSDAQELAHELKDRRLAVTEDDGTVFVYGSVPGALGQARTVIEHELSELGAQAETILLEHWLADEERWDDDGPTPDIDAETLAEGYAPWEVRVSLADHHGARELADQLESEGFGVVRRWRHVIAGCASQEDANALAARIHGSVEPGGQLVWETAPENPFAIFGGLADA